MLNRPLGYYIDSLDGRLVFMPHASKTDPVEALVDPVQRGSVLQTKSCRRLSRRHEKVLSELTATTAKYLLKNLEEMDVYEKSINFYDIRLLGKINKYLKV